ncbi:chalcone-flavanone isomerase, partial [Pilaira anomala]
NTDNEWKRLVGFGARFVNFDKSKFLKDNELAEQFLSQPYDISIRIVPARNTNTQHLRDGFLRLLMQRMKDQHLTEEEEKDVLSGIQEFKKNFANMKVKKNTEFIFTKTKEGGLKMVYEDKHWGTVNNEWVAKNFVMSYLDTKAPSSEAALIDIADGFERLLKKK